MLIYSNYILNMNWHINYIKAKFYIDTDND
jgi:hypothetical protein